MRKNDVCEQHSPWALPKFTKSGDEVSHPLKRVRFHVFPLSLEIESREIHVSPLFVCKIHVRACVERLRVHSFSLIVVHSCVESHKIKLFFEIVGDLRSKSLHIHHKIIKPDKRFVVPSSGVTSGCAENLLPVVASEIEGSGWHGDFEATVLESEGMGAVEHPNMARICAANATRHSSNFKFCEAVSWVFFNCRCSHHVLEQGGGSPLGEHMKELSVHLSRDGSLLFKAVKGPASSKVAK